MKPKKPEGPALAPLQRVAGRPWEAARALLLLGVCTASAAQALDQWLDTPINTASSKSYIQTLACSSMPPSAVNCTNNEWVLQCESSYGSTDPNDAVNNPCLAPVAPSGKSYVEQAQEAVPTPLFSRESVFVPNGSLQSVTPPPGFSLPVTDNFSAAYQSTRGQQEAAYGKMSLENSDPSTVTSWQNQEAIAQATAWNTPNLDALTYRRYTNTTENVDAMTTCENYVYRSFQDLEVWLDGLNACGSEDTRDRYRGEAPQVSQDRCIVNTSLNNYTDKGSGTPPAIFRRRPQNADGNYIYDPTDPHNHITELVKSGAMTQPEADPFDDSWQLTNVPKNAFYAGTEWLITPTIFNSMVNQGIDAQDFANELARGDGLYNSGQGVPTNNGGYYLDATGKLHQGFYDEWDFHNFMNLSTQATTDGQSREFRRRSDQVRQGWKQLANAMSCLYADGFDVPPGGCNGSPIPDAMGNILPGEEQEYESDPFMFNVIMSEVAPNQMASPPSLSGQVGFGANLQPAQYQFTTTGPNSSINPFAANNITIGALNIPAADHVPGALSPTAVTNSVLLGAVPPVLLANDSALQVEDVAATEARNADIFGAQQVMLSLSVGNLGIGLGGLGSIPGGFGGFGLVGGLGGLGLGGLGALGAGPQFRRVFNPGGGSSTLPPPPVPTSLDLSTYVQTFTPTAGGPTQQTSYIVDRAWTVNAPRWTTDPNTNLPILDCDTQPTNVVINPIDGLNPGGLGVSTTGSGSTVPTDSTAPGVTVNPVLTVSSTSTDSTNAGGDVAGGACGVGSVPGGCCLKPGTNLCIDSLFHTENAWPALCNETNLLIKEWERVQLGNPSCLDKTSVACDWVPKDFVNRYITHNVNYASAAKEIEYSYCRRWTGAGRITNTQTYTSGPDKGKLVFGVPHHDQLDLIDFRDYLDSREHAFEAEMKTVPVLANDQFGKIKTDGNSLGNSAFGGGYDYTLGWETTVVRDNVKGSQFEGQICRMGGAMQAGFDAFAVLFGIKIPIIDADVTVLANYQDDGLGYGWANLDIATYTVFNFGSPPEAACNPNINDSGCTLSTADIENGNAQNITGGYQPLNESDTEKPQFVEAPFQVSFITVTVSAGVLFDYGASLNILSKVPDTTQPCDPNHVQAWEASATFEPQANLGVWVDADVSLAGIVGFGVEVDLTLLGLGLPLTGDVKYTLNPADNQPAISFDAELDLTLNTLSGQLDFYIIAFWTKVASWTIVSWNGFTAKFPIFRTPTVYLDLGDLAVPGSIMPPGGDVSTDDI